jgi:hypothetical protein
MTIKDEAGESYRFATPVKSIAVIGAGSFLILRETNDRFVWHSFGQGPFGRRFLVGTNF